ncbi:MAG TPA: wax ester/triacylglycerol synthase family O-acyltransferase [Nocardioidaceae bacterium]|nr:wax ester/triacylglycerol synthase family O-acyltransferase [Nocardioidaceae bacterium]
MRQLSSLDAQFLHVESSTTTGHVGSVLLLDPSTAPGGELTCEDLWQIYEERLHLAPVLRKRLVEVPLALGRPYWADDPDFDLEFHLREIALPGKGTEQQLGEQVARIHARPLDRTRPLWEAYLIHNVDGGRVAFYSKIHHAAIDGVSGAEILATLLDFSPTPREVDPPAEPWTPSEPSLAGLAARTVAGVARHPVTLMRTLPRSLPHVLDLPGAANVPGVRTINEVAGLAGRLLGRSDSGPVRDLRTPRTPLNKTITAHRRFSFGSVPLEDVKAVKNAFGMTLNDVVMALTTSALRRWMLDHDGLPSTPIVVAVPVSIRADEAGSEGNQVSVMLAEMPTHLHDPRKRLEFVRESMYEAKRQFKTVPATILQDLSAVIPTALSGLAARSLFRLVTMPGLPFNLFVSNVPGPQMPLYVAGARVLGIYPVSAVTDMTGALNITLFSYDGALDFGLIAAREVVPDVWNLIGYLRDALEELLALDEVAAARSDG